MMERVEGGGRRSVGVLGATGMVGQRFVERLHGHPWFDLVAVGASTRSVGGAYADVVSWKLATPLPAAIATLPVRACTPSAFAGVSIVFSALDSTVAGAIEDAFVAAGFAVFTNAASHRMDPFVPIVIPFVNPMHLDAIGAQRKASGAPGLLVANANCSSSGLVVALRPLADRFGVEAVHVVTMQAISGAGYPGVSALDIVDNVIPFIGGEQAKLQSEPLKILGEWDAARARFVDAPIAISAQCTRVPVRDGHLACCSVRLATPASVDEVKAALREYRSAVGADDLPSSPDVCIRVLDERDRPQPRLDRDQGAGFTVCIGGVEACAIGSVRFVVLSHNTVLGAAGGSILNAELAITRKLLA